MGVVLSAQLTATVTSTQTVDRLNSTIRGPADLAGKKVATVPGKVAAAYLTEHGAQFVNVASADDGYELVLQGEVQALRRSDAAVLEQATRQRPSAYGGSIFTPDKYGIAVADGSPCANRSMARCCRCMRMGRTSRFIKSGLPVGNRDAACVCASLELRVSKGGLPLLCISCDCDRSSRKRQHELDVQASLDERGARSNRDRELLFKSPTR